MLCVANLLCCMDTDSKLASPEGKTDSVLPVITKTDEWVASEPVDTPEAFESQKRKLRMKYESSFANEEEFDLFCMMPVNSNQRDLLYLAMQKEKNAREGRDREANM